MDDDLPRSNLSECSSEVVCRLPNKKKLWHRLLGHLNNTSAHNLKIGIVVNMDADGNDLSGSRCKLCAQGMWHRFPFNVSKEFSFLRISTLRPI